jgi:hypothetical protein
VPERLAALKFRISLRAAGRFGAGAGEGAVALAASRRSEVAGLWPRDAGDLEAAAGV